MSLPHVAPLVGQFTMALPGFGTQEGGGLGAEGVVSVIVGGLKRQSSCPIFNGSRLVARDGGLGAADHRVRRDPATVALAVDRLAETAAERHLVAVVRALDSRVGPKGDPLAFGSWPEQCHRVPPTKYYQDQFLR